MLPACLSIPRRCCQEKGVARSGRQSDGDCIHVIATCWCSSSNCLSEFCLLCAERLPAVAVVGCSRADDLFTSMKHLCHFAHLVLTAWLVSQRISLTTRSSSVTAAELWCTFLTVVSMLGQSGLEPLLQHRAVKFHSSLLVLRGHLWPVPLMQNIGFRDGGRALGEGCLDVSPGGSFAQRH